ncbi:hypothetical protein CAPTEDRAFT_226170 [Capitella teleta]|uniref:Uncharacterized protein n=1 Tax=Capitella teleta TaxID=283909 RepID=R7UTW8_CAPTE|nr:hypothetical protein CAPTEDRAFT_226170 [Capitella teleta]|eukprot:ELU07382.1 hypothetical protein CAPTEDRAFT_226170 [Capitella teleta]
MADRQARKSPGARKKKSATKPRRAVKEEPSTEELSATAPGEVPIEAPSREPSMTATYMDNRTKSVASRNTEEHIETRSVASKNSVEQDVELDIEETIRTSPPTVRAQQIAESMSRDHGPSEEKSEKASEGVSEMEREFDSLDPHDYGIDFSDEEFEYDPPERDETLPDLFRLMASLEDEQTDLDKRRDPPSLFTRPEHVQKYSEITDLRTELEEAPISNYVEQFTEGIREDVLLVGNIHLEEIQEEELRLRDEHIAYQEQEAQLQRMREQEVLLREEDAKKRVAQDMREKRRKIARREEILQQKERLMLARLQKAFRKAENHLVHRLEDRKGEVKVFYGDLMLADGHYGGSKGRRWKVDWDKTPQPMQIKLQCLRGVKDKLPGGRYVLMVSLYNRLGGNVMRWSNLKGQNWAGATLPLPHDGHFYNTEMKIDQSVFTVLPAQPGVRPGMILLFELFLLRGAVVATDRVVGWGVFPIADAGFDIVEGKFKCPMLRGEMDFQIDKHDKLEALIASDIDHWLCNLYFEAVKLPRYLAGQKEYEVELQFSSGMVAYPDRVNIGDEYRDGEAPLPGSIENMQAIQQGETSSFEDNMNLSGLTITDTDSITKPPLPMDVTNDEKAYMRQPKKGKSLTHHGSRTVHADRKVRLNTEISDDDSDYEKDEVYRMKREDEVYPVKDQAGVYYKKHSDVPVEAYHRRLFSLLPKTPIINKQRKKRKKLTHLEELDHHSFSVSVIRDANKERGHTHQASYEKLAYIARQLLAELGLSQWRSREFWGMLFMFVLIFFVRIYIHYAAQWLLLQAITIPINKFDFLPYTVNLNYQGSLLETQEEVGVVLMGPGGNFLFFIILIITSWLMQKIMGGFPDVGSKFVVVFGIQTFLDPILILIVDCALGRYKDVGGDVPIGDCAKLYWHFYRAEGSGLAGIFITLFLYVFTCFATGCFLYMYFLRLHNNGRMLDIYWRLHGDEDMFFVPYDLEMSNQELAFVAKKAEQWRGEDGERRKVAVYDYIWEEENAEEKVWDATTGAEQEVPETKEEITTHVAIHTLHLDGLRELYRHFLRLPDGAITEVFGDIQAAGMDKDVKEAVAEQGKKLEKMAFSNEDLRKIPGRSARSDNLAFEQDDDIAVASSSAGSLPETKKAL